MSTPQRSGSTGWYPANRGVPINAPVPHYTTPLYNLPPPDKHFPMRPIARARAYDINTNNNNTDNSSPVQRSSSSTVHSRSPHTYSVNSNDPPRVYSTNNPYIKHNNNLPNNPRGTSGRKPQFTKLNLADSSSRQPITTQSTDQSYIEIQQHILTIDDIGEKHLWQSIISQHQLHTSGYNERYAIIDHLRQIVIPHLQTLNYTVKLEPFGSLSAKIALVDSDIDIALRIYRPQFQLNNDEFPALDGVSQHTHHHTSTQSLIEITETISRNDCEKMLKSLANRLRRMYTYVVTITKSTTQIVTLKHRTANNHEIECDFKLYHHNDAIKSHLLQSYVKCDKRVQPFIACVKIWARRRDLNDASRHTLNSFTLVMMAILSLQCIQPPVVPVLPTELFINTIDNDNTLTHNAFNTIHSIVKGWSSANTCNILELLKHFFSMYSTFDNNKHMPSIIVGKIIDRPPLDTVDTENTVNDSVSTKSTTTSTTSTPSKPIIERVRDTVGPSGEGRKRNEFGTAVLAVQDPFDANSNPGRAVSINGWAHVISEIQRANRILINKNDPRQSPKSSPIRSSNIDNMILQPITNHPIDALTTSVAGVSISEIQSSDSTATKSTITQSSSDAQNVSTAQPINIPTPPYEYINYLFQQTRWIAPAVIKQKKKKAKKKTNQTSAPIPTNKSKTVDSDIIQNVSNLQTAVSPSMRKDVNSTATTPVVSQISSPQISDFNSLA